MCKGWSFLVVLAVLSFGGWCADKKVGEPAGWDKSAEEAQTAAAAEHQAYALFFCDETTAATAGEGKSAITDYKKAHPTVKVTPTLMDSLVVVDALKKVSIKHFAKVPTTAANAELVKKYKISGDRTFVICAPDGRAMQSFAGAQCVQGPVLNYLKDFEETLKVFLAKKEAPKGN